MDQSVTGLNDHSQSPAPQADHELPSSYVQHEGANTPQDLAPSGISVSAGQRNVGPAIARQYASSSGTPLQGQVSTNHLQMIGQNMIEGGMSTPHNFVNAGQGNIGSAIARQQTSPSGTLLQQPMNPPSIGASGNFVNAGQGNIGSAIARQYASSLGTPLQGQVSMNHLQNMIERGMSTPQFIWRQPQYTNQWNSQQPGLLANDTVWSQYLSQINSLQQELQANVEMLMQQREVMRYEALRARQEAYDSTNLQPPRTPNAIATPRIMPQSNGDRTPPTDVYMPGQVVHGNSISANADTVKQDPPPSEAYDNGSCATQTSRTYMSPDEAAAETSSTDETPPPNELQEALAVIEKLRQQLKEKERTDIVQQNTSINSGDALSNMRRHNISPRLKQQ